MDDSRLPAIELLQGPQQPPTPENQPSRGRRWKLFVTVFVFIAVIGLGYTYARAPVYQTTATVLTVKPKAVDTRSEAADTQHVVIQERLLQETDLLQNVANQLALEFEQSPGVSDLRQILSVKGLQETNLVALQAQGTDPALLARAVNLWAQAYEDFRAAQIQEAARLTTTELTEEQQRLQENIDQQQLELKTYRENNNILSLERDENEVASKLKGLQRSLNRAREKLVDANAHLSAVQIAIERGDTVIPKEQRASLKERQLQAKALRTRIADLKKRYTQVYIDGDPTLKVLPEQLAELEASIKHSLQLGQTAVLEEARQTVETETQAVQALEQQLRTHEQQVKLFSERFEQHKVLKDKIAQLEELYADNNERLTKIQIRNREKYPPVQVVDQARIPEQPVSPDYQRDAAIALLVALLTALFVTWLREYLDGQHRSEGASYTGIRVFTDRMSADNKTLQHHSAAAGAIEQQQTAMLPDAANFPLELNPEMINTLLESAEPTARLCMLLLLTGVSPLELLQLNREQLQLEESAMLLATDNPRRIELTAETSHLLRATLGAGADPGRIDDTDELNSLFLAAAIDAGISETALVTADNIRFTYLVFLVRQGARLSELPQLTGKIQPRLLQQLAGFSPPGKNRALNEINRFFPVDGNIA